jgi:hypothetical protein
VADEIRVLSPTEEREKRMSSRASAKVLIGVALLALPVGGVISGAEAKTKKKPCKKGKEHNGCKLGKGAEFTADLLGGSISIAVVNKGEYVIDLRSSFPGGGRDGSVCGPVRKSVSGPIKVGKTYTFAAQQNGKAGRIALSGAFKIKAGGRTGEISGAVQRRSGGQPCMYRFAPGLARTG